MDANHGQPISCEVAPTRNDNRIERNENDAVNGSSINTSPTADAINHPKGTLVSCWWYPYRRPLNRLTATVAALALVFVAGFGLGYYSKSRRDCFCRGCSGSGSLMQQPAVSPTVSPQRQTVSSAAFQDDDSVVGATASSSTGDQAASGFDDWSSPSSSSANASSCHVLERDLRTAARVWALSYIDHESQQLRLGNVSVLDDDTMVLGVSTAFFTRTGMDATTRLDFALRPKPRVQASTQTNAIGDDTGEEQPAAFQEPNTVQSNGVDQVFIVNGDNEIVMLLAATSAIASRTKVPLLHPNSGIAGMILVENRLVVFVQEMQDVRIDGFDLSSAPCNVTILVYNTDDMILQHNENVQGRYNGAHAVGANVYLVTDVVFHFETMLTYLSPLRIQGLVPDTALDDNNYGSIARQQLEAHLDPFIALITASLDCSGLVQLPAALRFLNNTYTGKKDEGEYSLATVTSFNVASPVPVKNTTSLLLPSGVYQTLTSTDYLVVLAADSIDSFNPNVSRRHAIPFKISGASVSLVPPSILPIGFDEELIEIDLFKIDARDYIGLVSATNAKAVRTGPFGVTVLEVSHAGESTNAIEGHLAQVGSAGARLEGTMFAESYLFAVMSMNDTCFFYTVDLADPSNPRASEELEIPGCPSIMHVLDPSTIVVVGGRSMDQGYPQVHVILLRISDLEEPQLMQHWSEDSAPGNGTISTLVSSMVDCCGESLHYDAASNALIVPVQTSRYRVSPCQSSDLSYQNVFATKDTVTCYTDQTEIFDGYWIFKMNGSNGTTGIHQHFVVDHLAPYERCGSAIGFLSHQSHNSLVFVGDVTTIKMGTVLTHDLLTKAEAAPLLHLNTDCTNMLP